MDADYADHKNRVKTPHFFTFILIGPVIALAWRTGAHIGCKDTF
jgi:hypothetical protein